MKLKALGNKMLTNYNVLRNKTIEELKKDILLSYSKLKVLNSRKDLLLKMKENENTGTIASIYNRIFNKNEETLEEIEKCNRDEEAIKEDINRLEQEKRMKELAAVNNWWKANEEYIASNILAEDLAHFKQETFKLLLQEIDKDEVSFIQTADQILLNFSLKN